MTIYDIKRWDVVLNVSGNRIPLIYFKPDKDFTHMIEKEVNIQIKNTNTIYDSHIIPGVIRTSEYTPNYRPNFFAQTGLYVIYLKSSWEGYPKQTNMGNFSFVDMENNNVDEKTTIVNNPKNVKIEYIFFLTILLGFIILLKMK